MIRGGRLADHRRLGGGVPVLDAALMVRDGLARDAHRPAARELVDRFARPADGLPIGAPGASIRPPRGRRPRSPPGRSRVGDGVGICHRCHAESAPLRNSRPTGAPNGRLPFMRAAPRFQPSGNRIMIDGPTLVEVVEPGRGLVELPSLRLRAGSEGPVGEGQRRATRSPREGFETLPVFTSIPTEGRGHDPEPARSMGDEPKVAHQRREAADVGRRGRGQRLPCCRTSAHRARPLPRLHAAGDDAKQRMGLGKGNRVVADRPIRIA